MAVWYNLGNLKMKHYSKLKVLLKEIITGLCTPSLRLVRNVLFWKASSSLKSLHALIPIVDVKSRSIRCESRKSILMDRYRFTNGIDLKAVGTSK